VPVRHWVCTFPWGVRAVLGYDKELGRAAASAFAKELSRSLKRRAKRELGLSSVDDALPGLVVVVQRTDGALRLNCHLHLRPSRDHQCRSDSSGCRSGEP
jgi:hypothetical protein